MARLKLPASLMSIANSKTIVGMMSSPPATPRKLLTAPIASPARKPNVTLRSGFSGPIPESGMNS